MTKRNEGWVREIRERIFYRRPLGISIPKKVYGEYAGRSFVVLIVLPKLWGRQRHGFTTNKLSKPAWYCKCGAQSDARHNLVILALTFGSIVNKSWTTAPML